MTPALRHLATQAFLRLSLAIVLACAIGSFGSPARASHGSAFNAFTSDVSLGPTRPIPPEKIRRIQRASSGPDGAGTKIAAHLVLPSIVATSDAATAGATWFASSILAPPRLAAAGFQARAPPFS